MQLVAKLNKGAETSGLLCRFSLHCVEKMSLRESEWSEWTGTLDFDKIWRDKGNEDALSNSADMIVILGRNLFRGAAGWNAGRSSLLVPDALGFEHEIGHGLWATHEGGFNKSYMGG